MSGDDYFEAPHVSGVAGVFEAILVAFEEEFQMGRGYGRSLRKLQK